MDVGGWLRDLGLGKYEAAFRDNGIDESVLPHLTVEDLKEIGVASVGDRRKLLTAIGTLSSPTPSGHAASPRFSPAPPKKVSELSAERRPIAVMFCDLVGSTALASRLDAEDWRSLVNAYLDEASGAVNRLGGHVLKRLGDGLMALFGYPQAQENDAERAVRAALAIQRALGEMNARNATKGAPQLSARIGLESGPVVVEATGEVFGEAPNTAARVQGLAEPGAVLVTANVQRQTAGLFVAEDKGAHELKGVPAPVTLYRIVRASGGRRAGARALTPLVGRGEELELLRRRWERARAGAGQLTLIVGEPGIGKSRLVEEFRATLGETPHTFVELSSSQLLHNTPLHPIAEWGRQRFGADEPADRRLADLENTLRLIGLDPNEYASLIAPLVDIPLPEKRAVKLVPEELRRRQLAALVTWFLAGARSQPVTLVFEDLHWADPTSLDLMQTFAERGAQAPLLILATARPEFHPPWSLRSHHSVIALSPLDRADVALMVGELAARHALSQEVVEGVSERTGGVPLFVEEVTRLLLERGEAGGLQAIPPTLQQSLAARLDRLGEAREVAQIGAVLGRDFTCALLGAVGEINDLALQSALDRLSGADLLYVEGAGPQANYRFKHALIQDAAYESLLKSRRQALHRRAAEILRDEPERAAGEPEVIAHHFTEAGLDDLAIEWWQRAGDVAMARSGHAEAIRHFSVALDLLTGLGESTERAAKELELCVKLGPALVMVKGTGSPEVEAIYSRATALDVGADSVARFKALWGLYYHSMSSGRLSEAAARADELLGLARRLGADDLLLESHHALWSTSLWCGNLSAADEHSQEGISRYDRTRHHALAFTFAGHDPGVCAHGFEAIIMAMSGFPQNAMKLGAEAVTLARSLSHPYSLALAIWHYAIVSQVARQRQNCRELAAELLKVSQEQGFQMMRGAGMFFLGWATADGGELEQGIASMEQGLALFSAVRQVTRPYMLAVLASAKADLGKLDEGLELLKDALASTEVSGERWWQAELHRLRGRLLVARREHDEGEACFRLAIDVSSGQRARTLELRAATSLARLWSDRGKNTEAYDLLAAIYGWFTEGFNMPDLKEAKILLDALAP
jgi:class 3 adenylate cyclase/predicted ATPase